MVDLEVLKRVANNVRAAYYGDNCVEAQYIDLTLEEMSQLREENKYIKFVLKRIIDDLPVNRDWLDPDLERAAKEIIKAAEGRDTPCK